MRLHAQPGAAIDDIERLEERLQRRLPDDYTAFLLLSSGVAFIRACCTTDARRGMIY